MRYDTCKRCPRNKRCNKEIAQEERAGMSEYITCSRCGIVKRGHICPHKTYKKRDKDSTADHLVFNRTVTLKDTFQLPQK